MTTSVRPLSVVVVDDDDAIRTLLTKLLTQGGGLEVVGSAADGEQAQRVVAETEPDVILLDLLLDQERGTNLIGPLLRCCPTAMIAMLTALPAETEEGDSLAAGAFVYYEKTALPRLEEYILEDHRLFSRALDGEEVVAPWAASRRDIATSP
jgi:chemotaxis response regulator CheB